MPLPDDCRWNAFNTTDESRTHRTSSLKQLIRTHSPRHLPATCRQQTRPVIERASRGMVGAKVRLYIAHKHILSFFNISFPAFPSHHAHSTTTVRHGCHNTTSPDYRTLHNKTIMSPLLHEQLRRVLRRTTRHEAWPWIEKLEKPVPQTERAASIP